MSLRDKVAPIFARGGDLERVLPGYESRQAQQDMAMRVADAIDKRSILLAEAGTGTGKTFAYCVPALLSGKRVVISTATKNLQDQIANRDLPRLLDALGIGAGVQILKGRQNYLCLHRLTRATRQASLRFSGESDTLAEITKWAGETETGDRAELLSLPDDFAAWRDLDAKGDTCLGHRCDKYAECFVTRARQKAAAAEIVVVNHHLFFADLALRQHPNIDSPVLPSYEVVIFDEAHALDDAVTDHFGVSFSETRVHELQKDVLQALQDDPQSEAALIQNALTALPMSLGRMFSILGDTQTPRALPHPADVDGMADAAKTVAFGFEALADALEEGDGGMWESLADRARRLSYECSFVFAAEPKDEPPRFARMVEQRARSRAIKALPLDISNVLSQSIFGDGAATILTSATLSVAGDFKVLRDRLGISAAEEIVVESPFDYPKQARLFVPAKFPEPKDGEYPVRVSETLLRLNSASKGGAFFLFTSHAALDRQMQALSPTLLDQGYRVLRQGQAPKHALLDLFEQDGSAVLFATASFWEGVDVPGDALRLVCIDKLPFGAPNDPLLSARIQDAERRGESPFDTHQLTPAVIALRQGFGRLIRTTRDRGVVAILDVRLRSKGYGRKFLRALPRAPLVGEVTEVELFFESLKESAA
jgi:ATP-dependent DNA helicase DinG